MIVPIQDPPISITNLINCPNHAQSSLEFSAICRALPLQLLSLEERQVTRKVQWHL
jgi:hypothetical protein